jgi:hypothetical protein
MTGVFLFMEKRGFPLQKLEIVGKKRRNQT